MLTACSALALGACGGGEKRTDTWPSIDQTLAESLAVRSDGVAERLESGNSCGAKNEAAALERELIAAINRREIPSVYLEDLLGDVHEIQAQIVCRDVRLPPPPGNDDEGDGGKGKDKGKGKGKHRKHGGEDDD